MGPRYMTGRSGAKGCFTYVTKSYVKKWFRITRGHGWRFEDHDQEKCTSPFNSLGYKTWCKASLNNDIVFSMNI